MRALVLSTLLVAVTVGAAAAQDDPSEANAKVVRVIVRDTTGAPIPFALVQPHNRTARTASDSGVVDFKLLPSDSMRCASDA